MKKKVLGRIRAAVKVLLCVSLLIAIGLLLNYIRNLSPTSDGFDVTNVVARVIHGDAHWTWKGLTTGVSAAFGVFGVLFCVDKGLDLVCCKEQ